MSGVEKTIEELEAEVMDELEEGMHDAPKKGAVPAEPMKKKQNGEMQDTGICSSITDARRCTSEKSCHPDSKKFLVTHPEKRRETRPNG